MNKHPLKNAIQVSIKQQQLTAAEEQQLLALFQVQQGKAQQTEPSTSRQNSNRNRFSFFKNHKRLLGFAISCCFILSLLLYWPYQSTPNMQNIADEVAKNHIHLKPLDITTHSMADIQNFFVQLDFAPVPSNYLNQSQQQMLGGRYCSIQGVTAAQLRLQKPNGDLVTFYQVSYDPNQYKTLPILENNDSPLSLYAKGVKVTMWGEKGLLMVKAENDI